MGTRTLRTDWAKHQASDPGAWIRVPFLMGVLFSLLLAAQRLSNFFVMLLRDDQTELGQRFYKMRLLFFPPETPELITLGKFGSFLKDHQTS